MSTETNTDRAKPSVAGSVRTDLTEAEVRSFHDDGWVKLEGLITPELAAELLRRLQAKMGVDARTNNTAPTRHDSTGESMWSFWSRPSKDDELFRELAFSPEIGQVFRTLVGRQGRYYSDSGMVKLPNESAETDWHQDWPTFPIDRTGTANIWIALDDVPPERGAMRFLTGSHRSGVWGQFFRQDGVTVVDEYPHLLEQYELSPPLSYRPGDATVHSSLMVHSAPENKTDKPRWAFVETILAADALYTGQPHWITNDCPGLQPWKPLPDDVFPRL